MMRITERPEETKPLTRIAYSFGTLADNLALQNFMFLGFAYYLTHVGLQAWMISVVWIMYSIWDAFDDPMIGVISDRTKTRWGRRKIYVLISWIPLCLLMIILWFPGNLIQGTDLAIMVYLLAVLILFDLIFTMFTVNFNGLWPEMFLTDHDRRRVGLWRSVFTIVGLLIAFLTPEFIIGDLINQGDPEAPAKFLLNGIIAAAVVFVTIAIMFIWGSFERKEFAKDAENAPTWKESFRITLKNRAFVLYAITALAVFIVYNILPTIVPFYAEVVIENVDSGIVIFVALLTGMLSTPLWMYLQRKLGIRKAYMLSIAFWAISLPIMSFIPQKNDALLTYILVAVMGVGLGGSLYLYDQGIAVVIDDDSARSGLRVRREGAYYGVIAFFNRFSTGINFAVIAFVFTGTGWGEWEIRDTGPMGELGVRFLIGLWPVVILVVALICLYFWPLRKERIDQNKIILDEIKQSKL
ncbi:MAG: MFS transporter [Candidatus Lokiarchaeota archaeon]|nr:MFS transporter [Candidatus Lokiarchaeota archaeon]